MLLACCRLPLWLEVLLSRSISRLQLILRRRFSLGEFPSRYSPFEELIKLSVGSAFGLDFQLFFS